MKLRILLIITLSLLFCLQLAAQFSTSPQQNNPYDEKEILKKRAERYSARRNYEKATSIYEELIEKYPEDWEIVEDYLTILLRISKFEEADKLLLEKKEIMPQYNFLRIKIPLLIRQGESKKAEDLADEYLQENHSNINAYKNTASLFSGSRNYEKAAEILQKGRKTANDDYLFTLELARAYQSLEENSKAVTEYLKHLEKNKHYLHYVMNNLKGILNRDTKQIDTIADFNKKSDNPEVKEVYALSLAHLKEYEKALVAYNDLETIKLLNFAEELYKKKQDDSALKAYAKYIEREKEVHLQAEAQIMRAQIFLRQKEYTLAEQELLSIYNNEELESSKYRYRSTVTQKTRLLLAELAIIQDKSSNIVTSYLDQAAEHAYNSKSRKEIGFAAVNYHINKGELEEAAQQLNQLLRDEEPGTDIYKLGAFYKWQIAFFNKEADADSLLGELIIGLPQDELTTKALYMTQLSVSLPENMQDRLFAAWQFKGLYKFQPALEILNEIIAETNNDEIKILAGEWAATDNMAEAEIFWQMDYENPLLQEYAYLKNMENTTPDESRINLITSFLKDNPQSIFAPAFRIQLQNLEKGRN